MKTLLEELDECGEREILFDNGKIIKVSVPVMKVSKAKSLTAKKINERIEHYRKKIAAGIVRNSRDLDVWAGIVIELRDILGNPEEKK